MLIVPMSRIPIVINAKKQRKTIEWERLVISSRKLQIPREYFIQRLTQKKERYTHLNAEFQRITRRDRQGFYSDQCKEIQENN